MAIKRKNGAKDRQYHGHKRKNEAKDRQYNGHKKEKRSEGQTI
jgi:hypothetical protein